MGTELVKQDINFMENPLWALSEMPGKEFKITNDRGEFILKAGYKVPERTDMIFLLYLLMQSQKTDYNRNLEFSRYEILRDCGMGDSQKQYDRLKDSLERWISLVTEFKGTFYDNKTYQTASFHFIDSYFINEKTKKLKVSFNEHFLLMVKASNFVKYIDFEEYRKLRKPLSNRLYELLLKTFVDREEWEIEAMKLAEKLTIQNKGERNIYPSDVKAQIVPAVNEINKNTELKIEFNERRNRKNQLIFKFRLPKNQEREKTEKKKTEDIKIQELTNLLKEEFKDNKRLLEALRKYYLQSGYDYVRDNILYANKEAKTKYPVYLRKALEENWGNEYGVQIEKKRREEEQKQIEIENRRKAEEEARAIIEQEQQTNSRIAEFVNGLNPDEKTRFIKLVLEYLKGSEEFKLANRILNLNPEIGSATVAMFFKAFRACYDSYIQLNKLDLEKIV